MPESIFETCAAETPTLRAVSRTPSLAGRRLGW